MVRPVIFDSHGKPVCEDCGGKKCANYHLSQRWPDELWVGMDCLPAAQVDAYEGWRERAALARRRAATARNNFNLKGAAYAS